MDITISGTAEEIAALVLAVQGRRNENIPNYVPLDSGKE